MCHDFFRCISVTKLKMHKITPFTFDLIHVVTVLWDHCFFREANTWTSACNQSRYMYCRTDLCTVQYVHVLQNDGTDIHTVMYNLCPYWSFIF